MKLTACIFATLAVVSLSRAQEPDRLTIDVMRGWEAISLTSRNLPVANCVDMKFEDDGAKFISAGENTRATWTYSLLLPIDTAKFPTVKITYFAEGIDTKRDDYGIRLYTRERGVDIKLPDLVADGTEQTITKDISGNDTLAGIRLSVIPAGAGDAYIKIKSIEFEAAAGSEKHDARDDAALKVQVLDSDGKPVSDAKVIVDAERKSAARSADTDGEGMATITPVANEHELHMIDVQAEGFLPLILAPPTTATEQAIEIKLARGSKYAGTVKDEDGKPIAGATVRIQVPGTERNRFAEGYSRRRALLRTDSEGKFESPLLPEDNPPEFRLGHPEYASDARFARAAASIEDLKSGSAVFTMKK